MSITLTTPATFSYAINVYDPIYPKIIPNAIYSINSPLQFNTYYQQSAPNVFYLNAGTHNLVITGSGFQYDFIQNYEYEIDTYLENNNIALGENGELSGSINDTVPNNWESVVSGSGPTTSWVNDIAGEGWVTSKYFAGDNIGKYGVIYTPNSYNAPSVLRIPNGVGAEFPWVNGTTYKIDIYVSPSFQFENLGTFGPSLAPLTCSTSLLDPLNPSYLIGYIPSGASGVISFTRTAIAADDNFNIIAPLNAANTSSQIFPLVEWIKVYQTGSALADVIFQITQSQTPQNATSSFILEPYLPANFNYTDCDVLMNNFSQNDISNIVQEVLYDAGSVIPSNLEQIISGTAQRAEVNDYLYNASANTYPRYLGSKTTSQDVNLPSRTGPTNKQLSLIASSSDFINENGVANVEQYCNWFGIYNYIDGIQWNFPKPGSTPVPAYYVYLTTLLDINGNKIDLKSINSIIPPNNNPPNPKPNPLISNIPILQTIFPEGQPITLMQYSIVYNSLATSSFYPFNVYIAGYSADYYGALVGPPESPYNLIPNETLLILSGSIGTIIPQGNINGFIIPKNFNPKYTNSVLQIAQAAGF